MEEGLSLETAKNKFQSDALSRLRGFYASLSPSEKKVGDYITENTDSIIRMTLAEIATQSGVSEATAIRFCRSIGYSGWLEFKIALSQSFPHSPTLIHDDITQEDPPGLIVRKVFEGSKQALSDTLSVFDDLSFEKAINYLFEAERILIVGVGTSGPMAQEMFNRLFRLGLNCQVQTDSYIQVMQSALLTDKDVLVVITQTGISMDPKRTALQAKKNGCKIICITGNTMAPVTKIADVILLSVSHESRPETIASRIAQYTIIHALYVGLALKSVQKTNLNENAIWDALMEHQDFQSAKPSI
jgi:DNA-binding MurR/RpiR family transcriptional regulator